MGIISIIVMVLTADNIIVTIVTNFLGLIALSIFLF